MNCKVGQLIHELHGLHGLHERGGEPVCAYIYDLDGIRAHVKAMTAVMPEQASLFYAVKANPDEKIIEALLPLVSGFEVASIGELSKVRAVSATVPILFGGPGKKNYELEAVIRLGVSYIHVESLLELRRLIWLAKKWKRHTEILLRMNLRTDTLPQTKIAMGGRPSQFGLDEDLIEEALSILREKENTHVHLCGFHFHSLSNNLRADLHADMVDLYLQKVEEWKHSYGLNIKVVNAGGGFGVTYDGSPGFDWPLFMSLLAKSEAVQSLRDTRLFFEPGRIIVADYGYYAAEIVDIKRSHNEIFAIVRGGTHHNRLPASWGHNHPFAVLSVERWPYPFSRPEINHSKVTIVGELCTPKDRLHADVKVDRLRVGDIIVFEKSGAYCWTISHHDFLGHPHPEFYYLSQNLNSITKGTRMNRSTTVSRSRPAEQRSMNDLAEQRMMKDLAEQLIIKDLMDAFIAEQFFRIDENTTFPLSAASFEILNLFPGYDQARVYCTGDICFLVEKCYKQGWRWISGSPIYYRENQDWAKTGSPIKVGEMVLRRTLSAEDYAHPGVTEFLEGLQLSIQQLELSLERTEELISFTPKTPFDWYIKGERIASLRDRPFHPLSKAKIGFTPQNYREYMAEFGKTATMRWVAIRRDSVMQGCPEGERELLDILNEQQRAVIEREMSLRGMVKEAYAVMPVHPWQLNNILLPDFQKEIGERTIVILDAKTGDFLATSSVRSLTSPYPSTIMLKLPISVKSLGAARYLPVVKLLNGNAGEKMFRQALACDESLKGRIFLCKEQYWWGYMPESMGLFDDHPRHLAAQLRIYPEELTKEGYKVIPMSSLGVALDGYHFLTEILGKRTSEEEVIQFYTELAKTFYEITMRLFKVGIIPEIHGQNCCLVLKENSIVGLLFRDHDSVRLHQPYLDKHHIQDPGYHIRPGYSNSLYNETLEKLVFYVQSLGTQVNLASIMEALSDAYDIPPDQLWKITEIKLREALHSVDIPEPDRNLLHEVLFERKEWPVKLVIRPLLEADGVPGAMPSGKGVGYNPIYSISEREYPRL